MTSAGISRRGFIGGTAGAGVVLVIGAKASAQAGGDGPYGALAAQPDANGLLLPEGFSSRVIARAGETVAGTAYEWPAFPDGAATFPIDAGGWYQVVNSEIPTPGDGGASAIEYDADGEVVDAYRVLGGTTQNCAGGPTPWGTWLSCEEADGGQVWECDPTTADSGAAMPAMGRFHHEAAAVDPENERVYLTEDESDGAFYRFTPDAYPDLTAGLLEVASVDPDGAVTWYEVPDPAGADTPTRQQVPEVTAFDGGEGCWYADGVVYFTTKGDDHVRGLDTATDQMEVVYDGSGLLTGVDNITSEVGSGDLYVAEDGGDMQLVVITADGDVAPVVQVVGEELPPDGVDSEITGPVFSPDGTRLYFSSQRGGNPQTGITYEITGPFRGIDQEPAPTTTVAAASTTVATQTRLQPTATTATARRRCPSGSPSVPPRWSWVAWSRSGGAGRPDLVVLAPDGGVRTPESGARSEGSLVGKGVGVDRGRVRVAAVDEQVHAGRGDTRLDQLEVGPTDIVEQALPLAEGERVHRQAELVDQARPQEGLGQGGAAGDEDVVALLGLQRGDGFQRVALQHLGVLPRRVLQRAGDHVLPHRVHLVGEGISAPLRPGPGEALVLHPSEQQRVGRLQLRGLEHAEVVAPVGHGPRSVRVAVLAAGRLHHAIQGHELAHDQLAHGSSSGRDGLLPSSMMSTNALGRFRQATADFWQPPTRPGRR